jgi:hypothetical protein
MAYPDYSIVIVETTDAGVTTPATSLWSSAADAKAFYVTAVNGGKRAFLYEKPQPTLFNRNDEQPLAGIQD